MSKIIRALAPVVAIALAAMPAIAQEMNFKLATVSSAGEPIYAAMEYFAKRMEEKVGDKVSFTIHPSGELGSAPDVYEQVRLGAPIIQNSDTGYLADYVPDFAVLNGPYLLAEPADFAKIIKSDLYTRLVDDLRAKSGFELLSNNWFFGARHIIADREVRTPADAVGMTIRVPPNVMWIETFNAMGTRGVQLEWTEVYTGLSTGVVQAAEAPLASIYAAKLQESAKVVSMTGHFKSFVGLVMNANLFASLDPDVQAAMREASTEAGDFMTELMLSSESELRAKLEAEGVSFVTDVDVPAFQAATASVYKAFPAWTPGIYEEIRSILDAE